MHSPPHALHVPPSWLCPSWYYQELVVVVFSQQAGWPRGICGEMLAYTLSTYLQLLLVFCCLFHFLLQITLSLDPAV